jgi:hypothetical protein
LTLLAASSAKEAQTQAQRAGIVPIQKTLLFAAQNAVGPQVAEKPVGAVGRDLGHRAQQSRVAGRASRSISWI